MRCLTFLALCLFALPVAASAQVSRGSAAFTTATVVKNTDGTVTYKYLLRHPGGKVGSVGDLILDISEPIGKTLPKPITWIGDHTIDASSNAAVDRAASRPEIIEIASPKNWAGAIYYTGILSWGVHRYGGSDEFAIRRGAVAGFEITSPATPSFRRFRVIPSHALPDADRAVPEKTDSTWVLLEGYVLAPGYSDTLVDAGYLKAQVEGACWLLATSRCTLYRVAADDVAKKTGAARLLALRALRTALAQDRTLTPASRMVLPPTAAALERNLLKPPARR